MCAFHREESFVSNITGNFYSPRRKVLTGGEQFLAHGANHRDKHLAHLHHPAAHRGSRDFNAAVALQQGALPIQGEFSARMRDVN